MQIIHSPSNGSYAFILTEDEWYSATEQQQEAWQNQIMREGAAAGCRNVTLLVDPDAVMSVSPKLYRHRVWAHTFETESNAERIFKAALSRAMYDAGAAGVANHRIKSIFRTYMEAYK